VPKLVMRPIAAAIVAAALLAQPAVGWPGRTGESAPVAAQQPPAQQPAQPPAPEPAPPPAQPPAQPPSPPAPQEAQRIVSIEVRGTRQISAERVLAVITATKVGEVVSEDRLREDIRAIVDLGVFTDVTVRLEPEGDGVRVVFVVVENPVITEVIVEGATAISADEVRKTLGVPIGEVLNLTRMREGARAVEKLYEDKGYVLARVADIAVVPLDPAENTARLRLRISEGRVEAVQFSGLRRTRDSTARRQIKETVPGRPFNVNELNRDLQRLFDTGLFESIHAQPRPGEAPDSAVIVIEVKEARTNQISGGVGYDSVSGVLGFVEYQDRNWRGLGQTLGVRAERGLQADAPRFNYELSFTEPFLDDQRTALGLEIHSRSLIAREYSPTSGEITSRFEFASTGASGTLSRPIDPLTTASLRLKTDLTEITPLPIDPNLPESDTNPVKPPSLLSSGKVVSLTLGGIRDARDDRLLPRRGDRAALSMEFATRLLGSDFTFSKYALDYQHVFPVGRESAVLGRLFVGSSFGTLPLQERFILGGPSTVRALPGGFLRDTSILVANVEYRFPLGTLIRQLGEIQTIVFVDAGTVPLQFGSFHSGYGVGVAVKTPVGPLRIDFAFGGPQGRQTWLSVGSPF
jgi:outer membrane protein insertion porin family